MKSFQYHINGQQIRIRLDERAGTIADFQVNGKHPDVAPADMPAFAAAISLALIAYEVEVVHDEEPGIITLSPQKTSWGSPSALISQF